MSEGSLDRSAVTRFALVAVASLLLVTGCSLDREEQPDLVGPADNGVSVDLVAAPDTLNADGVSQSVVRMVLRDQVGKPIANRSVLFVHDGDGLLYPSASSTFVGPVQTGLVMATDRDGVAYVVYVAGTGIRSVSIAVRPYGIDTAFSNFYRTVEITQR
jgi:hypothetical protein